jgi:hypothetical protein
MQDRRRQEHPRQQRREPAGGRVQRIGRETARQAGSRISGRHVSAFRSIQGGRPRNS